jgi:hypothetical protein
MEKYDEDVSAQRQRQELQPQVSLSSCSGNSTLTGRLANNICVQSIDGESTFELQDVIECNSIPSDLPEVATPDVASAHSHLRRIAPYLPDLEPRIKVELLFGRDILEIHHVHILLASLLVKVELPEHEDMLNCSCFP